MNKERIWLKYYTRLLGVIFFSLLGVISANAALTITSVSPTTGMPVTGTVVIAGTGFNDTAARNIVRFGGVQASVTFASANSLTVTVPAGAQYDAISVLNLTTRSTAYQDGFFTPIYDNGCLLPGSNSLRPRADITIAGTIANSGPRHAALGDMDGDGKADLVVCTYNPIATGMSEVFVYRNTSGNGIISYATPVVCTSGALGTNVKLADLDGDGKLDIIVGCGSGVVSCIRNTTTAIGTLSFAAKRDVTPHAAAPEVAIADFDGDGKPDIAAVCYTNSKVKLFRNQMTAIPTGRFPANFFGPLATFDSFDVGSYSGANPGSISAADFDKDGKIDIVTSNTYDGTISVLRNTSVAGAFSFDPHVEYPVPGTPTEVQTADMDGDGKPEIIVGDFFSSALSVFANVSTPSAIDASSFTRMQYTLTDSAYGINIGDLDGDGKPDIVMSRDYANNIVVLKNTNTTGNALSATSFAAGASFRTGSGSRPQGFCIGDMDGDGKPDIATANYGNNTISIFDNYSVPLSNPVTGTDSVCAGATTTLSSPHCATAVGYWSATNGHATITGGTGALDTSAVVTGVSAGRDTMVYAVVVSFDTAFVNFIIDVKPLADTGIITGPATVCEAATITLSDTSTGGVWSSSSTLLASVNAATGMVTGNAAGNVVIRYTRQSMSCGPLTASYAVTVNALPHAGTIAGPTGTCVGAPVTLTASATGGVWGNAYPLLATQVPVGSTNMVTGTAIGLDTITYTVTTALCGADTAIKSIAIVAANSSLPITGDTSVCIQDSTTLFNSATGGTWATDNALIATVDATTGRVTGISAGTTRISYTITYSCGPIDTFVTFVVRPLPAAGTISGATYMCPGGHITLTVAGAAGTGTWSSSAPSISTVDAATGVVSATGVGADTIFYTVTNSCGSNSSFFPDTVRTAPPTDSITGAISLCQGMAVTLSTTGGGTSGAWASSAPAVATINGSVVTALAQGSTIISYTVLTTCGLYTDTAAISVYPQPGIVAVADQAVCNGATFVTIFNGTVTGTTFSWVNSNTTIGLAAAGVSDTILFTAANTTDSVVSSTVRVTPIANGCTGLADTFTISAEPTPVLSGTLAYTLCDSATFTYIPATTTAGVTYAWSRAAMPGIANIAGAGTDTISEALYNTTALPVAVTYIYTLTINGCTNTQLVTVTVNPRPTLTGTLTPSDVCSHTLFSYSPATSFAGAVITWHRPSVTGLSNFAASGFDNPDEVLRDTTTTTIVVPYTFTIAAAGCSYSQIVTVNVKPRPVLAGFTRDTICSGTAISYTATAAVPSTIFAWVRPAVAGISPASNTGTININETLVNTTFQGLEAVYIYTLTANGCAYTQTVTVAVDPVPSPAPVITIKSSDAVCSQTTFMNFGTSLPPADTSVKFIWTTTGSADVYARGSSGQYALINFNDWGDAVVTVTAKVGGYSICALKDTFAVAVGVYPSDRPYVLYLNNIQFVCLPSDEDSYQWGYDDAELDSTIIPGQNSQDYVNATPDFSKYYWVMTTRNGCLQKTYYTAPLGVQDVNGNVASIKVYPNPATEKVTVELAGTDPAGVSAGVYDMAGRCITVTTMDKNHAVIDVGQLSPGVYLIDCYRKGIKIASSRFVKN